ncbi:MAG: FeoB-associated Cys-rich membrane protein [Bacteroidaceae bacterium]|nr:FeoB-associated Cys-rich membrane protein [Bacteroidaceae bacterium]MBO7588682.1 FeoB-associated Cys-rich membrane protein [Bacteroidaceae bacterium]MBP5647184.1 FeoB-associated Cys-rich membrane protein [Bacteroidaceae bacterium]
MNAATIISIIIIALLVIAALFSVHRNRRKGKSCCGCPLSGICKK